MDLLTVLLLVFFLFHLPVLTGLIWDIYWQPEERKQVGSSQDGGGGKELPAIIGPLKDLSGRGDCGLSIVNDQHSKWHNCFI